MYCCVFILNGFLCLTWHLCTCIAVCSMNKQQYMCIDVRLNKGTHWEWTNSNTYVSTEQHPIIREYISRIPFSVCHILYNITGILWTQNYIVYLFNDIKVITKLPNSEPKSDKDTNYWGSVNVICIFASYGALKSDSTHHFFRNACTKSGSLRFSQFSGCWLILSVYIIMSFDFAFVRLFGVR
jgi:hypothetical protein